MKTVTITETNKRNIVLKDMCDFNIRRDKILQHISELKNVVDTLDEKIRNISPRDLVDDVNDYALHDLSNMAETLYSTEHDYDGSEYTVGVLHEIIEDLYLLELMARNIWIQEKYKGDIDEICRRL